MKKTIFSALSLIIFLQSFCQVNFNALTSVPTASLPFQYGVHLSWYDASWSEQSMLNIAAGNAQLNVSGLGANTYRPKIYEQFTSTWGIGVSSNGYAHAATLNMSNFTLFVDLPVTAAHAENVNYGCSEASKLYANMYEPIWDGGANGTPVNENNYYAVYIYQLAQQYKNYIKFWEIINEPDQDWGLVGWRAANDPAGNWWSRAPQACELKNMYVPFYRYVRLMRISYEVIKSVDASAYITPGGIGYSSFLDCLLRYSDNPVDGSVTATYPFTGGAYFDAVSFHSYPHLTMPANSSHSDNAIQNFTDQKATFDAVLNNRGYNGTTYPAKVFLCTENNVPRRSINGQFGGDEAQRNYIMKSLVQSQKLGLKQIHYFVVGESAPYSTATNPFDVMGFYTDLHNIGPAWNGGQYLQQLTNSGIAYKTTVQHLKGYQYDAAATSALNLSSSINGGVFTNAMGEKIYVLWAKTTIDDSELASAVFNFPSGTEPSAQLRKRDWNYSSTGLETIISSNNIQLSGTPVLLLKSGNVLALNEPTGTSAAAVEFNWSLFPNPVASETNLKLTLKSRMKIRVQLLDMSGKKIGNLLPETYYNTGSHSIRLKLPERLAAGNYVCNITAGRLTWNTKLALAK